MSVLQRLQGLRPEVVEGCSLGALLVLIAIALSSFQSSYGGYGYLVVGTVAAAVGLVIPWLAQRMEGGLGLTAVIAALLFGLVGTWLALRHYAFLGFIPTPRSVYESYSSSISAWRELLTTVPPVGNTGDLMIIPVFTGYVAGSVAGALALQTRLVWPVMLAPATVLGLGIATGTNDPVAPVLHGCVLASLMVAWLAWQNASRRHLVVHRTSVHRKIALGAAMLGIAAVGGYLVAPSLPGHAGERTIWRQTVTPPFDPRTYPSPLAGYRDYVKLGYDAEGDPNPDKVMFTIEGLPEGMPIRLATMDSYDGLYWQVSGGDPDHPSLNDSGSFERVGAQIAPETDGETAEVTITVREYSDVWVPDVGEVISIRFDGSEGGPERDRELADSFRYNRATDTGATPLQLRAGDRYVMKVRLPASVDAFEGKQITPVVSRLGSARSVSALAQRLGTADVLAINDTGQRLDLIAETMEMGGVYSDGDRLANQQLARAGHSEARLTEFVDGFPTRPFIGNAEQYASAYALLFRDLDNLPTRVVMGFLPRDEPESGRVDVHQTEVEAWVEVPVADLGWVAIFPTPPREQLSVDSNSPQQPEPDYRTQNPPPPPVLDPEFDRPATAAGEARELSEEVDDREQDQPLDTEDAELGSQQTAIVAMVISTPLIVAVLLAGIIVLVKLIRRRRRRTSGAPERRIARGWREVTDLSTDLGRPVSQASTRREAAQIVGGTATALAQRTDATVWAGQELTDEDVDAYWAELTSTLKDMRTQAGFRRRLRAAVSIQSLKPFARRPRDTGRRDGRAR